MKSIHTLLYTTCVFFLFSLSLSEAYAQNSPETYIKEGILLHDKGDYQGAISLYLKALNSNPESTQAMYELSLSYLALKEYAKAIEYSTKVLKSGHPLLHVDAYIVKSNTLSEMGKPQQAIELLKEAISKHKQEYILHYHIALQYLRTNKIEQAVNHLERCISMHANAPEVYYTYAYTLIAQSRHVEAYWVLCAFLLIEPDGEHSKEVFASLWDLLANKLPSRSLHGKSLKELNLDLNKISDTLSKVKSTLMTNSAVSDFLYFQEGSKSLLSELQQQTFQHKKGLLATYFIPMFTQIMDAGYFDTFCRYISACYYPHSLEWWKTHNRQVNDFIEWFDTFDNTHPQ